jgi:hypothetical protein
MNDIAYRAELERVIQDLIKFVDNKSLDPIIVQAINYAYVLGKNDGYVNGVQAVAGDQR